MDTARALYGPLTAARHALAAGRISEAHVGVLATETAHLDPDLARAVADRVVGQAEGRTPGQLREKVRAAVIKADPAAAETAAQRATRTRRVQKTALPDAQAELLITGPAVQVQTVWTALDLRAARTSACDARTLDQRRFDALVTLCQDADLRTDASRAGIGGVDAGDGEAADRAAGPCGPAPGRRRGLLPAVHLHADAATWCGLAEEPVQLDGYGPIPAGTAREHSTSSAWRAVVTDALTRRPTAVSDTTYRPSARTSRLLHLRDRGCLMPGCTAAVWHCDADHRTPHNRGGQTDPDNCGLLCRRHHASRPSTTGTGPATRTAPPPGPTPTVGAGDDHHTPARCHRDPAQRTTPPRRRARCLTTRRSEAPAHGDRPRARNPSPTAAPPQGRRTSPAEVPGWERTLCVL